MLKGPQRMVLPLLKRCHCGGCRTSESCVRSVARGDSCCCVGRARWCITWTASRPPLVTAPASPWSCPACIVSSAVHTLLPPHAASASTRCFCLHTLLLPPHTASASTHCFCLHTLLLPPHAASASTRCFCLHTLLLPPHTAAPTAPQADRPQPAGLCEWAVVFVTAWVVGAWLLPPPTPSRERQ